MIQNINDSSFHSSTNNSIEKPGAKEVGSRLHKRKPLKHISGAPLSPSGLFNNIPFEKKIFKIKKKVNTQ